MPAYRRPCRTVLGQGISSSAERPRCPSSRCSTFPDPHDAAASVAQARALEAAGCEMHPRHRAGCRCRCHSYRPEGECGLSPSWRISTSITAWRWPRWMPVRIRSASTPATSAARTRLRAVVEKCRGAGGASASVSTAARWNGSCGKNTAVPAAEAMVESARRHIRLLEQEHFYDYVLSLKHSNVKTMLDAYRIAAEAFDCPLHLGVTEAGSHRQGWAW